MASEANVSSASSKDVLKFGKDPFWKHGEKVGVRVSASFVIIKLVEGLVVLSNTWHTKEEIVYLVQKSLMMLRSKHAHHWRQIGCQRRQRNKNYKSKEMRW